MPESWLQATCLSDSAEASGSHGFTHCASSQPDPDCPRVVQVRCFAATWVEKTSCILYLYQTWTCIIHHELMMCMIAGSIGFVCACLSSLFARKLSHPCRKLRCVCDRVLPIPCMCVSRTCMQPCQEHILSVRKPFCTAFLCSTCMNLATNMHWIVAGLDKDGLVQTDSHDIRILSWKDTTYFL